mmetsp:Transcript_103438/g.205604  ORF Transcript_103438/g.205604 Transcript_103438/m.205604 type:complete len:203 (+) Transcript_103438:1487-2095(+)
MRCVTISEGHCNSKHSAGLIALLVVRRTTASAFSMSGCASHMQPKIRQSPAKCALSASRAAKRSSWPLRTFIEAPPQLARRTCLRIARMQQRTLWLMSSVLASKISGLEGFALLGQDSVPATSLVSTAGAGGVSSTLALDVGTSRLSCSATPSKNRLSTSRTVCSPMPVGIAGLWRQPFGSKPGTEDSPDSGEATEIINKAW